jgi:hypothetical protein
MKAGVIGLLWFMCGAWFGDVLHQVVHGNFHDNYSRIPSEFWLGLAVNVVFIVLLCRSLKAHRNVKERALGVKDLDLIKHRGLWVSLPTNYRVRIASYVGCYFVGILVGYLVQ